MTLGAKVFVARATTVVLMSAALCAITARPKATDGACVLNVAEKTHHSKAKLGLLPAPTTDAATATAKTTQVRTY